MAMAVLRCVQGVLRGYRVALESDHGPTCLRHRLHCATRQRQERRRQTCPAIKGAAARHPEVGDGVQCHPPLHPSGLRSAA